VAEKWREPFIPQGAPLLYRSWANYPVFNFSYSLANDISKCGQYTRYSRFQGITAKLESASFKFGICCEDSIVDYLRLGGNPEESFAARWLKWKGLPLKYTSRDASWDKLNAVGKALMRIAYQKLQSPPLSEVLVNPEFGVVLPPEDVQSWYKGTRLDYIADIIGHPKSGDVLLDVKTAGSTYEKDEDAAGYVALDPQLLVGSLVSGIRRVGFIALIKTASPRVEYVEGYVSDRALESIDAWLKEQYDKLVEGRLYMKTGVRWPTDHCLMCDYLCKCLGNEALAKATLRIKESKNLAEQLISIDDL
jgi:hypothetical protein